MDIKPSDILESRKGTFCYVCGDNTGTYHYGSICCSGCKGFFRRTVRFNKLYTCPYARRCVVSKDNRNLCKACRFEKCLKVGMSPLLVKGDRKDNKKHDPITVIEELDNRQTANELVIVTKNYHHENTSSNLDYCQNMEIEIENIIIASKFFVRDRAQALGTLEIIPEYNANDFQSITKYYSLVERLCDAYSEIDMTHLTKEFDDKCSLNVPQKIAVKEPGQICHRTAMQWDPKVRASSAMFKYVWCRCAALYFDWASHVHEIKELNEQDKEILLVGRCIPITWLTMGYKSVERNFNGIVFSGGSYFPGDKSEWAYMDKDLLLICEEPVKIMMNEFVQPAIEMKVTETEYILLRQAKAKYISALSLVVQKFSPHLNVFGAMSRMSKLIMLISVAERVAEKEDNGMSLMSLFNIAHIRGTLPYDIHIRRYNVTGTRIKEFEE
uniref:Nuclear receptor domain-containing protein n=1 Tax=Acrobeloides nanus TaxID=290746 RepID=A0A914E8T3_9BILA